MLASWWHTDWTTSEMNRLWIDKNNMKENIYHLNFQAQAKKKKKKSGHALSFREFVFVYVCAGIGLGGLMIASFARPFCLTQADNSLRPRSIRDGSAKSSFGNTHKHTAVRTLSCSHQFKPKCLRLFWKRGSAECTAHLW